MAVLDNTVVNVALPEISRFFHVAHYNDVIWISTAYFLAQAAVIPAVGYISDIVGTKTVFLTALGLFVLGSGLCAVAPNLTLLIVFRIFQGIGGGALFPIVFAITFRIFPPSERGQASAAIGVPVLLAPAFGPTIGGYLTTNFDWRAIFTVNLPIGVIAFVLAMLTLRTRAEEQEALKNQPGLAAPTSRNFDVLGLLLALAGVSTLVYGISEIGTRGISDPTVLTFMGIGIVLTGLFIYVELAVSKDPVLDLRLFKTGSFTIGTILTGLITAFFFGSVILFPIFFQNVLGYSPLNSGEIFILQGLTAALGVFAAGRLYNRVGPRILTTIGLILITLSTIGLFHLDIHTTGWSIQGWLVMRGLGLGLTNTPLQTFTLSQVNNRAIARASSLTNVMRQIFSAIGVAMITSFVLQQTTANATSLGTTISKEFATNPPTGTAASCIERFIVTHAALFLIVIGMLH